MLIIHCWRLGKSRRKSPWQVPSAPSASADARNTRRGGLRTQGPQATRAPTPPTSPGRGCVHVLWIATPRAPWRAQGVVRRVWRATEMRKRWEGVLRPGQTALG